MYCFIDNEFVPLEDAKIPVNDLGLQRAYAIFDFLRITDRVPLFLNDHLDRFYRSAEIMRLQVPHDQPSLRRIITDLVERNDLAHAGVKIMLTGGASSDGYQPGEPRLIIIQQPLPPPPSAIVLPGYKLVSYTHQRQMPEVKTTDYLMAINLQPWMKENGGDDILYHKKGVISECPRSNFFIVTQEDTLVTPAQNILKGITRKQLLSIAPAIGITVEQRDLSLDEIRNAKEAFITSSTKRLIPVWQVDDIILPSFSPTGATARLFDAFKEWERVS